MISIELKQAWAETAYQLSFDTKGRDFTPTKLSIENYIKAFFNKDELAHVDADTLGQNYDLIVKALESDTESSREGFAIRASATLAALEAHVHKKKMIKGLSLKVFDSSSPN